MAQGLRRAAWLMLALLVTLAAASAQRPRMAPPGSGLRRLTRMPPQQRERKLLQNPQFQRLPPEKQQEILRRLQRLNAMPPRKQQRIIRRLRELGKLTPQQRQGLREIYRQFQAMPPADRRAFRQAYHQVRALPPDERGQRLQQLNNLSPSELATLRHALALKLPADLVGQP